MLTSYVDVLHGTGVSSRRDRIDDASLTLVSMKQQTG